MINSFCKKVVGTATVLALVSFCLPQAAQALTQRVRFSGRATNTAPFFFEVDSTIADTAGSDSLGSFPGAVQNFDITDEVSNFDVCGQEFCPSGDLTVSRLMTEADGVTVSNLTIDDGFPITLESLRFLFPPNSIDFTDLNNVLRYDVSFLGGEDRNQPDIVWFVQSSNSSLINNLTGLGEVNTIVGFFPRRAGNGATFTIGQPVPEPSTVAFSVLGIGGLGVRSLLQYRKRLKKSA